MLDESAPQSAPALDRRLATILCADVASYSKMMAVNEERTVNVFRGHREIFESLVNLHRGRIFNTAGDALLAEFNSPVEAVRCATEIQAALRTRNEHLESEEKMQFRMGINLGDVIIQGGDLLGDGVNVAARIQAATAPGGICISGSVHDQIQNKLSLDFKLLGEQTYKNIPKPVRTYTINEGTAAVTHAHRTRWRVPAAITLAVLAIAGASYWGYLQYDTHRIDQQQVEARLAAQVAVQKQATEQAEQAKREMQLQTQKLAAEEEMRRVIEERNRIEQDRKLLEAEKLAGEIAKRQAAEEEKRRTKEERNRIEAEKRAGETAKRQAADEALRHAQEERNQLEQERKRIEADKQSGQPDIKQVTASQHETPIATPTVTPKAAVSLDGNYSGQLCTVIKKFGDKAPVCWPITLVVHNGNAEGSWISKSQKPAKAYGTVGDDGSVKLTLSSWTPITGTPVEANLLGRIIDGAITVSGRWNIGGDVAGNWKRTP